VSNFADAQIASRIRPDIVLYLGHFWSLCVEEQFYLIWPWIVFTIRDRRKLITICVASIVLVPFARVFALAHMPAALVSGDVLTHATPFRFDTLMMGALVALVHRSAHRERMQRIAQVILLVALLCAASVVVHYLRFGSYIYPTSLSTWPLSLVAVFSAALILRTLVPGTLTYRAFNLRWLRALGTISYGAYVFHDILHGLIYGTIGGNHKLSVTIVGFIITIILATISYRYFEAPILRLKTRFTQTA
jgi:peptidoglycan/LPS O-acetylase OafA/YrhL